MLIDRNRCIMCERCVRASQDIDKKNVFGIAGRGGKAKLVINSPTGKLVDSDFAVTDKAAEICPVGAIIIKRVGTPPRSASAPMTATPSATRPMSA